MSTLTYLASPYSHPSALVRHNRYIAVCRAAARLMAAGEAIFCPIAHSHTIDLYSPDARLPATYEFWMSMDLPVLQHCNKVKVLMLDGFNESKGVLREMAAAKVMGIPVEFIAPAASDFAHQELRAC